MTHQLAFRSCAVAPFLLPFAIAYGADRVIPDGSWLAHQATVLALSPFYGAPPYLIAVILMFIVLRGKSAAWYVRGALVLPFAMGAAFFLGSTLAWAVGSDPSEARAAVSTFMPFAVGQCVLYTLSSVLFFLGLRCVGLLDAAERSSA